MIFEILTTTLLGAGVIYYRATIDSRFLKPYRCRWNNLMQELNLFSKNSNSTFSINSIKIINNGFIAIIYIPDGLNYKDLEKHRDDIENSFCANIKIENKQFSNTCTIQFLDKELENYDFKPVKLKENQLYIGKTYDGEDYILDIDKNSNILILGTRGSGKTVELLMILTNLIYSSSNAIELHLCQITKSEVGMLRNCKGVQFFSNKLEDAVLDLESVAKKVNYRSGKFDTEGVVNIKEYNKYNKNKPMKRIYYVIEELSFFMPQSSDFDDVKELKNRCWTSILEIVKAGRSVGIHFISVSQRSTCTNLPSDVKSQTTRISFRQISQVDSINAIECENAMYLRDKQCLIHGDNRVMEPIKVPLLKENYISLQKFVPEIIIPKKYKEKKEGEKKETEAAVDIDVNKYKLKTNDKVEKVFYEDRKISEEELKEYYTSLYKKGYSTDNVISFNKSNRPGVIKGGAKKDADEKRQRDS